MEDGANCLIHFADEMQGSDSLLRRVSGGSRQSIRENLEPELEHKARKVSERFSENLHIITNEPSLAFFRIQEHVRKSLPQLVEQKHEVQEIHQNVQGACFDTEYAKNAVNAMQNSNVHFQNIQDLLKNAMFMKQQIEYEESRKQQERRQPSMYSTSGGGGSSGNLGVGSSSSSSGGGRGGRVLSRSVSDAVATSSTGSGGGGGGGGGSVGGGGGTSSRGGRGGRGGGGGGGRGGGRSSSSGGGGGGLNRSNTTDSCDSSVSLTGGSSQPGSTKPTTRPEKKAGKNRNQSKQDTNKRPSVKSKRTGFEPSKKPL